MALTGGSIQAVRNLTSFEMTGVENDCGPIHLDQYTFFPLISGSPSLVSLRLFNCSSQTAPELSRVTPAKLPELSPLLGDQL